MKKICLLLLLLIGTFGPGYAQGGNAVRVLTRAGEEALRSAESTSTLPLTIPLIPMTQEIIMAGGNAGYLMNMYVPMPAPEFSLPGKISQRSLWEQTKRDWKAHRLKQEHTAAVAFKQAKANLPQLQPEESFFTTTFNEVEPDKAVRAERIMLPIMKEPGVLYRGLVLSADGNAIANILLYGLRIQDNVGKEANTRILALSSHSRYHVMHNSKVKTTNLTDSPQDAVFWCYKRLTPQTPVPVIVQVTGVKGSGPIIQISDDIPAENINVFAKLKVNGQARWCLIELACDDNGQAGFKITPAQYVVKPE